METGKEKGAVWTSSALLINLMSHLHYEYVESVTLLKSLVVFARSQCWKTTEFKKTHTVSAYHCIHTSKHT